MDKVIDTEQLNMLLQNAYVDTIQIGYFSPLDANIFTLIHTIWYTKSSKVFTHECAVISRAPFYSKTTYHGYYTTETILSVLYEFASISFHGMCETILEMIAVYEKNKP